MFGRQVQIIHGMVIRSVGVGAAAEAVDGVCGFLAGVAVASLKQHMFEEMRQAAAQEIRFVNAAGGDKTLDRNGRRVMFGIYRRYANRYRGNKS